MKRIAVVCCVSMLWASLVAAEPGPLLNASLRRDPQKQFRAEAGPSKQPFASDDDNQDTGNWMERHPVWAGAMIGLVQAIFVLTVGVSLLPSLHPRMASEEQGPTVTRQLEPPGFLALNYGYQTPVSVVLAHLIYGAILGAFYSMR